MATSRTKTRKTTAAKAAAKRGVPTASKASAAKTQGLKTQGLKTQGAKNCVHHWVIDSPSGRESIGVCRHCSTERSFQNSNEQVMWEQSNTIRNTNTLRVKRPAATGLSDEAG